MLRPAFPTLPCLISTHESAHVVVALAFGVGIDRVQATQSFGSVTYAAVAPPFERAVIAAAGPRAEVQLCGATWAESEAWGALHDPESDRFLFGEAIRELAAGASAADWRTRCLAEADALLHEHRHAITRLANRLLFRGELTGAEAAAEAGIALPTPPVPAARPARAAATADTWLEEYRAELHGRQVYLRRRLELLRRDARGASRQQLVAELERVQSYQRRIGWAADVRA